MALYRGKEQSRDSVVLAYANFQSNTRLLITQAPPLPPDLPDW